MTVSLNSNLADCERLPSKNRRSAKPSAECLERPSKTITIGLINNMPDAALEATERQFLSLLDSASEGISVRLSLYSLPGVPRSESGARHIRDFYSSVENLWDLQLDGLIVTGREPLASNLADEPYWESFARVVDWARDNTYSTVWSCLAAHAAVLYMDGIGRVKNGHKHCGVFDCARVSDHPLIDGAPSRFQLPHSRWNGISEDDLTACGYRVLTRAEDVGVDTFIQQQKSLFVFFQGHPEYESNTLLLEYRRDVGRYLRGETDTYPLMPQGYFNSETVIALTALQRQGRDPGLEGVLAEVSRILEKANIENTWCPTAACIYRNWLLHICARQALRLHSGNAAAEAHRNSEPIPAVAAGGSVPASALFARDGHGQSTTSTASSNALTML